ncbi:MAG TPA: NAD(P)H-binding protein [Streptosporangiaceae bacterium]|jgi:nucleoside-diphosphate-sugar epimerase
MRVVIAGGHGQIGLRLSRQLEIRGDRPVGLIRNPDHADDVRDAGAEPVLCDLEAAGVAEVAAAIEGADAAVFAAGAGGGSGAARKDTMDYGGSVLLADAAERAGVRRFVQISSAGAGRPPDPSRGDVWAAYIDAKTRAEEDLRARPALDWTVIRPGHLTNVQGTGLLTLSTSPIPPGDIARDDVAAAVIAFLAEPRTIGLTIEAVNGPEPLPEAIRLLVDG